MVRMGMMVMIIIGPVVGDGVAVGVTVGVALGGTTLISTKKDVPWKPFDTGNRTPAELRSFQYPR